MPEPKCDPTKRSRLWRRHLVCGRRPAGLCLSLCRAANSLAGGSHASAEEEPALFLSTVNPFLWNSFYISDTPVPSNNHMDTSHDDAVTLKMLVMHWQGMQIQLISAQAPPALPNSWRGWAAEHRAGFYGILIEGLQGSVWIHRYTFVRIYTPMYMCIYICTYICMYVCIYILYMYIYIHTHVYFIYIYIYTHTSTSSYAFTYVYTYVCAYMHMCICGVLTWAHGASSDFDETGSEVLVSSSCERASNVPLAANSRG